VSAKWQLVDLSPVRRVSVQKKKSLTWQPQKYTLSRIL